MRKIVLYLLGLKGRNVLHAFIDSGYLNQIEFVVIGEDAGVVNDYAAEIKELCIENFVQYYSRAEHAKNDVDFSGNVAIAAGWRWLIMSNFFQLIVFHDSLLPLYRGFNPLVTALLNKDSEIGVTAIIANKDFDSGDIIEAKKMNVIYPVRIKDVIENIGYLYYQLTCAIINKLHETNKLFGLAQNSSKATYSVWRDEEDYRINWASSAEYISHFINCLSFPYKGASTIYSGELVRIFDAKALPDVSVVNRDLGKVIFVENGKPIIICGSGLLRIDSAADQAGVTILPLVSFRSRFK